MRWLIFSCLFMTSVASANDSCKDFFSSLQLPAKYETAFASFKRPEFLAPLTEIDWEWEEGLGHWELTLATPAVSEPAIDIIPKISANGILHNDGKLQLIDLEIHRDLSPNYAYRVLFAHLLERLPIEKFHILFDHQPDIGIILQQLALGESAEEALKKTPTYEALTALGFVFEQGEVHLHTKKFVFISALLVMARGSRNSPHSVKPTLM